MSLDDWAWADPVAVAVKDLRAAVWRLIEETGIRNVDRRDRCTLARMARAYCRGARWSPEVIDTALVNGAQIGGGWIVREIPGEKRLLTFVRCQLR